MASPDSGSGRTTEEELDAENNRQKAEVRVAIDANERIKSAGDLLSLLDRGEAGAWTTHSRKDLRKSINLCISDLDHAIKDIMDNQASPTDVTAGLALLGQITAHRYQLAGKLTNEFADLPPDDEEEDSTAASHHGAEKSEMSATNTSATTATNTPGRPHASSESDLANKHMSWEEISWDDLVIETCVGRGASGTVSKAMYNGMTVAVKELTLAPNNRESVASRAFFDHFYQELKIHSMLKHPGIVELLGACTKLPHLAIVTEFIEDGSLRDWLERPNTNDIPRDPFMLAKLAAEIADTVAYLHAEKHPPVIHRARSRFEEHECTGMNDILCRGKTSYTLSPSPDVSPFFIHHIYDILTGTVQLDRGEDGQLHAKLADFGISKMIYRKAKHTVIGSVPWTAPEILKSKEYSVKVDIYSFGIVLWELVSGKMPYEDEELEELQIPVQVVQQGLRPKLLAEYFDNIPKHWQWQDLCQACWQEEPQKRPNAVQIQKWLHKCAADDFDANERPTNFSGVQPPRGSITMPGITNVTREQLQEALQRTRGNSNS